MSSEEEIKKLQKKIEALEYKDIKRIEEKIKEIEINYTSNNVYTEQNTKVIEGINTTMSCMQETLIKLSIAFEGYGKTIEQLLDSSKTTNVEISEIKQTQNRLAKDFSKHEKEIMDMKKDITQNEEKSKFDFILFVKNHISEVIFATILGGIFLLSKFF